MSDRNEGEKPGAEEEKAAALPAAGILNVAMGVQQIGGRVPSNNMMPQQLHPFAHFGMYPMVHQQGMVLANASNVHQQNVEQNNSFQQTASNAASNEAKAPPKPPKKNKGGKSKHFTDEETGWLLDSMEKHIPIGGSAWRTVLNEYNSKVDDPDRLRDKAALQSRFQRLANHPKGTGDPNCPPDVIRAKRLERKRLEKANLKPLGTKKQAPDSSSDDESVEADEVTDSPAKNTRSKSREAPANTATTETPAPASNPRKKGPATKSTGKTKAPPKAPPKSTDDGLEGFLEVYKASEKQARKREREERKRERRKEKKQAKREEARERMRMVSFMTGIQAMTASIVTAITGEAPTTATPQEIEESMAPQHSFSSSGSSSSSSSSGSEDSPIARKKVSKKRKH